MTTLSNWAEEVFVTHIPTVTHQNIYLFKNLNSHSKPLFNMDCILMQLQPLCTQWDTCTDSDRQTGIHSDTCSLIRTHWHACTDNDRQTGIQYGDIVADRNTQQHSLSHTHTYTHKINNRQNKQNSSKSPHTSSSAVIWGFPAHKGNKKIPVNACSVQGLFQSQTVTPTHLCPSLVSLLGWWWWWWWWWGGEVLTIITNDSLHSYSYPDSQSNHFSWHLSILTFTPCTLRSIKQASSQ